MGVASDKGLCDRRMHPVRIAKHIGIPESQHAIALRLQVQLLDFVLPPRLAVTLELVGHGGNVRRSPRVRKIRNASARPAAT